MLKTILSIFILLHGLVHAWYVLLLSNVVKYTPDMGWTGNSWLFPGPVPGPGARMAAAILYALAGLMFVISGIGLMSGSAWNRPLLVASAVLSSVLILTCFDGRPEMLVQKGLIGLIINIIIIILILLKR